MKTLITGGSGLLGSEINLKDSMKPTSEELNLLEIAEVLQVTEGRVSQMKKAALSQLRDWMKKEIY